jgi:hypothetical protein
MITRVIVLVLVGLLIAGLIRKWMGPALPRGRRAPPIESARKRPGCDAYVLGASPEPCERGDCPFRAAHAG